MSPLLTAAGMLKDRVDILARDQKVSAQKVVGVAEYVIARGVPARIVTQSASRLATALGVEQREEVRMFVGPTPVLRVGWQVVARSNRQLRYTISSVQAFPAPHRVEFQVATLQVDDSTTVGGR